MVRHTRSVRHYIMVTKLSALLSVDGLIKIIPIMVIQTNIRIKKHGQDINSRRMLTEMVTLQIAVRRKKMYSMNSSVEKRHSPQMAVKRRRASN